MSPEAHAGYATPTARVPRELSDHAHISGDSTVPPDLQLDIVGTIILKIPDNWNGLDDAYFVCIPYYTTATFTLNIIIDAGQDLEAPNIHTQTVNPFNFASTANVFNYVDLATPFAVVLAALTAGDTVRIRITNLEDGSLILYEGIISES